MLVYNKYVSLQTMAIQDFSNFIMHQNHLEGLLKGRLLEATADFFWIPCVWSGEAENVHF